MKRNWRSYLSD